MTTNAQRLIQRTHTERVPAKVTRIFVSYAREDRERVAPLVAWLESAGFDVWWDTHIAPGRTFDRTIEAALEDSQAVIVVWSAHSIGSDWVQTEATEGLERDILFPVLFDAVRPPCLSDDCRQSISQDSPQNPPARHSMICARP